MGTILVGIVGADEVAVAAINDVLSKADLIVVGSVLSRTESSTLVSFDLTVDRVLTGAMSSPTIHVEHPWAAGKFFWPRNNGPIAVNQRLYGVWSLVHSNSSTWDLLAHGPDGIMPSLYWPASPSLLTSYQYSATDPTADKIVYEVASSVTTAGGAEEFLGCIGSTNTPAALRVLSDFVSSPNLQIRVIGLAGMMMRSQPGLVSTFASLWPMALNDSGRPILVSALRDSFRPIDATSVHQLALFADSPSLDADIREASVRALAAVHTKESLPFLASLLSSSDPDERMRGVFGLSSFANGCPPQTPDNVVSMEYLQFKNPAPFRSKDTIANFAFRRGPANQESELVSFWLAWWSANRASILAN